MGSSVGESINLVSAEQVSHARILAKRANSRPMVLYVRGIGGIMTALVTYLPGTFLSLHTAQKLTKLPFLRQLSASDLA